MSLLVLTATAPRPAAGQDAPAAPAATLGTWKPRFDSDPTRSLLSAFRVAAEDVAPSAVSFHATGLSRADYLKFIAGEVDFWKGHQDARGAIIDPYLQTEWQYSTPAFAHAAALLVVADDRADLLEPAALAMDWATRRLRLRRAATSHEDFYPPLLAHALMLLKPRVAPARAARWEDDLRSYDPYSTYRQAMGSMNWNIVSASGEALFSRLGLRAVPNSYVEESLGAQGYHFASPFGLYLEGPLAYDAFPRLFLSDALAQGYDGAYGGVLEEAMRRGALASLFMQSPWGELPAGGRSAHHNWNEAEQCVIYEIYAAKARAEGDTQLTGVYKRAAHLALASMQRWVRPTGEMQIVKNWVDPARRHAYESYSAHSQYNLLPMAMLSLAFQYAGETESARELPAPADVGGYVFEIPELHKVFANAGGTYVELDTNGDPHYDATGLIRVHMKGVSPQLGPSDGLLAHPAYESPSPPPQTLGVGAAWQDADGAWHTLGEMGRDNIRQVSVNPLQQSPRRVAFDVSYQGDLAGVSRLIEHYVLTPGRVELTTELPGYIGPLRYQWPVLADDGKVKSDIRTQGNTVSVSQDGGETAQTFAAPDAQSVRVEEPLFSNHNGWARVAVAEYAPGSQATLVIAAAAR